MKIILPSQIRDLLAPQLPPGLTAVWVSPDATFAGDPADAAAYFRWWGEPSVFEHVLHDAPRLRWVHTPSAGVEHLLTPALVERDISLTNSAGVHAIPIAEFVIAFLLSHAKGLPALWAAQTRSHWTRDPEPLELLGATLLIVGMGGIGEALAERAAAFGMRVWGSRRLPRPSPHAERVVGPDGWRPLLPEADYVVVAAPLTPATHGMIDAAALAAMKPTAYLVNVARGPLVDERALIEALRAGRIAGAALDTFDQEPLPEGHPLWQMPNVFVTPHATAYSPRMHERQIALFLENLQRFRSGQPLLNLVDLTKGY